MVGALNVLTAATQPYRDLNPFNSDVLTVFETASITPELREFRTQYEIRVQAMGSGITAISDYIDELTTQWNNAFALNDVLERSIAAQNFAVVRILPNYNDLDLPRGGKRILKSLTKTTARACLKKHSCNLHAPLCGIFCPNSVAVARYGALIRTKSPTNCDAHLAESLFQTRSRKLMQSEKIQFDPKEKVFYYKDSPDNKLSANQITVVASSLELFEEFSLDELLSFESKLEQNFAFALHHPVGIRIYEMLKNWNYFVSFEDITYYHARTLGEHRRPYHDSEMMKAPTNVSAHGRYNEVGRSCYYIAESKEGALKEIYKHSGGTKPRVQVIGLKAVKPVKLLDLSGDVKKTNRFIEHLRFTVENEAGRTVHEYLLPNYVASCCKEIGIDGIRYRSTGYNCCVLWKDDYFEYVEGSRDVIPE